MAFDSSQEQLQDDEKDKNASSQPPGQQDAQLSGGGGGFAGQAGAPQGGAAAPTQPAPSHSGSWTNLDSYLSANADQSQGLGQGIAQDIGNQATQAKSDLGSVTSGFKNQGPFKAVNSTTSDQVTQAFADPSQYATGSTTQPLQYLNNDWGLNSQNTDITQYAGSNGSPSWQQTQDAYTKAGQNLQNTQSESGRDLLLQNQFAGNGKQYNAGEQGFDQLLLQQNPGSQAALNDVYKQYYPGITSQVGGVASDLSGALTDSQAYAQAAKDKGTGLQTAADQALSSQISGLGTNVTNETNAANSGYSKSYDTLAEHVRTGLLTPDDLKTLGVTDPSMNTYGVNASSYLTAPTSMAPFNANSAATDADYSKFQGLQNLLSGYEGGNQATDATSLSNIGLSAPLSAPKNSFFNADKFNKDVSASHAQLQKNVDDIIPNLPTGFGGSIQDNIDKFEAYYNNNETLHNLSGDPGAAKAAQNHQLAIWQYQNALEALGNVTSLNKPDVQEIQGIRRKPGY